jgi:hypothetical protein
MDTKVYIRMTNVVLLVIFLGFLRGFLRVSLANLSRYCNICATHKPSPGVIHRIPTGNSQVIHSSA